MSTTTTTKSLHDLKKEREESQTKLFKECGLFWAFSNQQFEENKTPLQQGDKYVSIGMGGYLPKSQVDNFTAGMKEINKTFKDQVNATKQMRYDHIAYELSNHEAYYTGEIDTTIDALGSDYTRKEVWTVYKKEITKNNFN